MTTKIKLLLALNITLLAGVLFSLQSSDSNNTLSDTQQDFTLQDTSGVSKIELGENTLVKTGLDEWEVNNNYKVQPSRMQSLLAVLGRVQIKRPVPEASIDSVKNLLEKSNFKVNIYNQDGVIKSFELAGSGENTYARLGTDKIPYIIYIPGYFVNIYELFDIGEQAWRDKRVLYTTWRTLQKLDVNYTGDAKNSFSISFDSAFYKVEGIERLDSAKVYSYIQQYQSFEVESYVDDENLKNTLSETAPFCVMVLNDLYESRNNSLLIYPNDSTIYGVSEKSGELVKMNPNMLRNYLVSRQEFVRQVN
jgi:hypothetical protein